MVLCSVVNGAIRHCSNQTSRITNRDGKGSIFSVSEAVCVERKWVHSASMMLITRLHISPSLVSLRLASSSCNRQDLLLYVSTKAVRKLKANLK